jgi:selenide,water dikinase
MWLTSQAAIWGPAVKDLEKRKRVMTRSMQLGHCICAPKKACPCDVFLQQDLCLCAGERAEEHNGAVRLTELVERPGCASKIDQAALKRVLRGLPPGDDPRVLVGMPAGDDAGVFRLDGHLALVQTVDVFSPSVDDAYTFGQIAAANSLSDVYAMGGRPLTALSVVGFPIDAVPEHVLHEILHGGIDKMAEAGVAVIGGHSIHDREIKAGFAVTGVVEPEKIVTNDRAQPRDRLILTKPLGTGIIAFAAQIGRASAAACEAAARSMAALNKSASELMIDAGAHACTDVTGFGLIGHLAAMASASKVDVEINCDDLPLLPEVLQSAVEGVIPGATERNRESSAQAVVVEPGVEPAMLEICFDAQTSGGLLIAVPESRAEALLEQLRQADAPQAAVIGRVCGTGSGRVLVRGKGPGAGGQGRGTRDEGPGTSGERLDRSSSIINHQSSIINPPPAAPSPESPKSPNPEIPKSRPDEVPEMSCCEGSHPSPELPATATQVSREIEARFQDFLKTAGAPGALDVRTKRAVAIALSVLARCEPCVKSHVAKAREMGFSQEEIDEAAWLAISFGGSPTMMFYKGVRKA